MVLVGLLLGLVIGLLAGAAGAWALLQRRAETGRAEAERTADQTLQAALQEARREAAERAAEADAHTRAVLTAQQDAALARVRQEEAEHRADVEQRLSAALAQAAGLQEALGSARAQQRETVEAHRREQADRERHEAAQGKVLERLAPVAQQLTAMQRKVEELEKARAEQHGQLAAQIRQTQASVEQSKRAAEGLASALKNNAVRGLWGETQLRTLVEAAGMVRHVDFHLQHSITADSGERRPDMVVRLPGGLSMPVDAKVPYNAFIEAFEPDITEPERQRLLLEHAKKVKGHIDALAKKEYWTGLDAPELTVAYIPNDQLLAAALDADGGLLDHAISKGVVLATPTNLLGLLKTIALAWRQETLTEEAHAVFKSGEELYRRIGKVAEHADKLRRSIEGTVKHYNEFAGSFESRVLPAARRLDASGAALTAPAQIEAHTKRFSSEELSAPADRPADLPADRPADDLAALADVERPDLDLTLAFEPTVVTETLDEADAG